MKQKKKRRAFRLFCKVSLITVLLLIGGILTFSNVIKDEIVEYTSNTNNHSIVTVSVEDVKKNQEETEGIEYDFSAVEALDLPSIVKASAESGEIKKKIVSGISIPSVGISENIYKGVSNRVLAIGAGTMKPEQELGKGNYALAGHTMDNKNLLFGKLTDVEIGDEIYVTDKQYIYTYKVSYKGKIKASDVHVIEDREGETMITLVTCADNGKTRFIVQGTYLGKIAIENVSSEVLKLFQ